MSARPHLASTAALPRRSDVYYWRLFIQGLGFFLFGVGTIIVGSLILPPVALLSRHPAVRRLRVRRVLSASMRAFVAFLSGCRALSYEFTGAERLGRPGQLIVANHPSLLDAVFLLAFAAPAGCVVKHAMLRNPLTRGVVTRAGYISNQAAHAMIADATAALAQDECLIMFPEGTRTTSGKPLRFHRGAANIAVRAATVVTPVFIHCAPPGLTKSDPWYRITPTRIHFVLRVGSDIDLREYRTLRSIPVACRALNQRLQECFEGELRGRDELYCPDSAADR